MTCDVEFLHPRQFTRGENVQKRSENVCMSFVQRQIQCLKCIVFIVVLLSVGNTHPMKLSFSQKRRIPRNPVSFLTVSVLIGKFENSRGKKNKPCFREFVKKIMTMFVGFVNVNLSA